MDLTVWINTLLKKIIFAIKISCTMIFRTLLFLLLTPTLSFAGPDFSQSTFSMADTTPLCSAVAPIEVVLRNTGDGGGMPAYFEIRFDGAGYLIDVQGLDSIGRDDKWGTAVVAVNLPPGSEKRLVIRLLTFRETRGGIYTLSMQISDPYNEVSHWMHQRFTLEPRPPKGGVTAGRLRIAPAGLVFFGWIIGGVLVWLIATAVLSRRMTQRRQSPQANAAIVTFLWMMPVGFWLIFAASAWRDFQILTRWRESEGVVIGQRMEASTSSSHSQDPSTGRKRKTTTFSIEIALKYKVNGTMVFASGYDSGSFLQIGGRARREKELEMWKPGAQIRCWYNPDAPEEVVVRRGFGGAYFFALFPLPFFIGGVIWFRKMLGKK